ncbi:hypothetical protein [Flavobacterium granuli]|uniref:Uncharacterized protein n=1 Tax=Flavobacterium granuli TaxID=280093 RepID=A0ABU1S1E0_9FLAO|nr:hypothetical protein [Flavobacterium granuli]MDR6844470.1 hypothetical protein [Flavobacterium granuli]
MTGSVKSYTLVYSGFDTKLSPFFGFTNPDSYRDQNTKPTTIKPIT